MNEPIRSAAFRRFFSVQRVTVPAIALAMMALLASGCRPPGDSGEEKLPAPTGITVTARSPTSIRISWSEPAGAEGCNLYRSDSETGTFVRINSSLVTDSFYDDTGLISGFEYWYKVIAVKDGKEQTASTACSGTTGPPLGALMNVKVSFLSVTSLRVSWDALVGADGYNVYRSTSQYGVYLKVNALPVGDVHHDDGGLTPATEYWYKAAGLLDGVEQGQSLAVEGFTGQRWAKSYGGTSEDCASVIRQTGDGGYVVAGYTMSFGAGNSDFWTLKLSSDGALTWQRTYGGSSEDKAYAIQQTADGGYIVAGYTKSFGAGGTDAWVLKLDSVGAVSWQKTYGSGGNDGASCIQQTADGGYIVAGTHGANNGDFWVLKLDADGAVNWQKRHGDALEDRATSIQQTVDGGYIVAGSSFAVSSGLDDVWLLKLDADGALSWQKKYGGAGVDMASSVQQTTDGGYIVAGKTYSFGADSADFWVLKLSSDGTVGWQELLSAGSYLGGIHDAASSIRQTADGGYIVAGCTEYGYQSYDCWVVKLTSNGSLSWQRAYGLGSSDAGYSIQVTTDGGYTVAGYTASFGAGGCDVWVLKLPGDGQLPGAQFLRSISPVVFSSNASPGNTAASATGTAASVTTTAVITQDSYAAVSTQYP